DPQREAVGAEAAGSDAHVEGVARGRELRHAIGVVARAPGGAVEDLDEGFAIGPVLSEEDPRDDRPALLLAGIDQLVVPALEEGPARAARAVVALRVQDAAHGSERILLERRLPPHRQPTVRPSPRSCRVGEPALGA